MRSVAGGPAAGVGCGDAVFAAGAGPRGARFPGRALGRFPLPYQVQTVPAAAAPSEPRHPRSGGGQEGAEGAGAPCPRGADALAGSTPAAPHLDRDAVPRTPDRLLGGSFHRHGQGRPAAARGNALRGNGDKTACRRTVRGSADRGGSASGHGALPRSGQFRRHQFDTRPESAAEGRGQRKPRPRGA